MRQLKFQSDQVPVLGIGTWHMGDQPAKQAAEIKAIQYGINHGLKVIDTAEMYGAGRSEILVGKAIAPYARQSLFLTRGASLS